MDKVLNIMIIINIVSGLIVLLCIVKLSSSQCPKSDITDNFDNIPPDMVTTLADGDSVAEGDYAWFNCTNGKFMEPWEGISGFPGQHRVICQSGNQVIIKTWISYIEVNNI